MSSPYGPPAGAGPQGPGAYGAPGQPPWGAPGGQMSPAGQSYGGSGQAGPGYGVPAGQGAPGQWPAYGPGFPGRPGQGPGGPGGPGQWGVPDAPRAPTAPKAPVDLGRLLPFVVGGLGVLGFVFGFLPSFSYGAGSGGGASVSASVYGGGPSYLPILLLIAGLLAVAPLLPGAGNYRVPCALLSVAGLLGAIAAILGGNVFDSAVTTGGLGSSSTGIGLILLLVVAVLQAAAAGYAWLLGSGGLKARAPKQAATLPGRATPGGSPFPPSSQGTPAGSPPAGPAAQGPPAGGFGGYQSGGYMPYRDGGGQYGTGATPAVDPSRSYGQSYPSGPIASVEPEPGGPGAGQHGRDDGPPPDVTQQVRF